MQNLLKFIESADRATLHKIENAVRCRREQLTIEWCNHLQEAEEKERANQWNLWKDRAQSLMDNGANRYDAIQQSFNTLSNLWICRNHESTCLQCGEEIDDYYEFLFRHYIQVCSECTDNVDLTDVFDVMKDEIQESKRIKSHE